jgi:hypothetical protein
MLPIRPQLCFHAFRSGVGPDGSPGRIEAFFPDFVVQPGTWSVWEGTYTIVKSLVSNIFQLFHAGCSRD